MFMLIMNKLEVGTSRYYERVLLSDFELWDNISGIKLLNPVQ